MTSSKSSSTALVFLPYENRKTGCFFVCLVAAFLFCANTSSAQTALHAPGWVVITISDYRTLHAKAYPPDREPEGPPVDATLTRVDYDLRIDGDLAAGRASLTVDVLERWLGARANSGWTARSRSKTRRQTCLAGSWCGWKG